MYHPVSSLNGTQPTFFGGQSLRCSIWELLRFCHQKQLKNVFLGMPNKTLSTTQVICTLCAHNPYGDHRGTGRVPLRYWEGTTEVLGGYH